MILDITLVLVAAKMDFKTLNSSLGQDEQKRRLAILLHLTILP